MSEPLIDRLSGQAALLSRLPMLRRAVAAIEELIGESGGKFGEEDLDELAKRKKIKRDDLQFAISALRMSGLVELAVSVTRGEGKPSEIGEPQSISVFVNAMGGRLSAAEMESTLVYYRLKDPSAPDVSQTTVESNGWPDGKHTIEDLLDVMSKHSLIVDANRVDDEGLGTYRFSGNFVTQSHVFNIRTNDTRLASRLMAAVSANRRRPDYVTECERREADFQRRVGELRAAGDAEGLAAAERAWPGIAPVRAGFVHGHCNKPTPAGAFVRELHVRAALANGYSAADVIEEDAAVQGTYRVLVPASLSDGQAAACALDGFHSNVAVGLLEAFEFTVLDPKNSVEIAPDPRQAGYELADQCISVIRVGGAIRSSSADALTVGDTSSTAGSPGKALAPSAEQSTYRRRVAVSGVRSLL